ncbi:putative ser thr protein phosphatase family [Erysiphe necator]|uniref:Putative ser thr protein phosphatase family n=1 Tax=Uncinula necator TaxID=52586 RepID=A0A0B1P7E9_UNCNE|nr:putative ser thr protein phosphatase family [Erysiphe necator]
MAKYFLFLALVALAVAEQPEAVAPVTAPQRRLPLGQLNFLHTTDIHGWYAGHLQQGQYSADIGDYSSFIHRMREKINLNGSDLLLIDTGDRVDGNGLYDASKPKGLFTFEIIKELDYDVLTLGNHELYLNDAVDDEYKKLATALKEKYISSNVNYIDPETGIQVPFAQRYRVFRTKNQGIKVAAFGFMFNFFKNANNTVVQRVEDTVKEKWFQAAIREDVDLFLVCGHIPLDQPEYKIIHQAIRAQKKHTPIQIFGAHSHIRNFVKYDSKAYGLQSGKYLETIGWASIDGVKKSRTVGPKTDVTFMRRYIDNNMLAFRFHTGLNATTFPTDQGKNISSFIRDARRSLDLDKFYGCVPRNLYLRSSHLGRNDSILTWLVQDVFPYIVKTQPNRSNEPTIIGLNTGFLRYDLIKGPYTRDTKFIIAPFENYFRVIKGVPYDIAIALCNQTDDYESSAREQKFHVEDQTSISLHSQGFKSKLRRSQTLQNYIPHTSDSTQPDLVPGFITVDDGGTDGDDTLHKPLHESTELPKTLHSFVNFPDKGDPKMIDLVYGQYVESSILATLNDNGFPVNENDVRNYRNESINWLISDWVKNNWPGEC